ncbi:MAG: universal stress protein [Candidatus Cybelea sp.]
MPSETAAALVKVLCATDTSDDGYRGLKVVSRIIDRDAIDEIRILMVTWPARRSKIWERAGELWLAEHDLHQAMEIAVERELKRFETVLHECAKSVVAISEAGEPSITVLENAASMNADLILLVITSDPTAATVSNAASRIIAKSPVPVIVVHGSCDTIRR